MLVRRDTFVGFVIHNWHFQFSASLASGTDGARPARLVHGRHRDVSPMPVYWCVWEERRISAGTM